MAKRSSSEDTTTKHAVVHEHVDEQPRMPRPGHMVDYYDEELTHRAAIVVETEAQNPKGLTGTRVDLRVFLPDHRGLDAYLHNVPFSVEPEAGCWTWPE